MNYTKFEDGNGKRIPYNALLDMTVWDCMQGEHHFPVKIRKSKRGANDNDNERETNN